MTAQVVSLNVSLPIRVRHRGRVITTGIFKQPVSGTVQAGKGGLHGDGQADRHNHGGVDKAVYAYPSEHYAHWQPLCKRQLPYGSFGENLTLEGLLESQIHIGDRIAINDTVLEVSQPRIPCYKLALALKQPLGFVKTFAHSGRLGFYLRVVKDGQLNAHDSIQVIHRHPQAISVAEVSALYFTDTENYERMKVAAQLKALPKNISGVLQKHLLKSDRTGQGV